VNFAVDVVEAAPGGQRAILELARDGARREWSFAQVAERARGLAGALAAAGVRRGDVVLTLVGTRPEWVAAMVACFRQGFVVLPCTEQLRAGDLRLRLEATRPAAVVCDPRNRAVLQAAGCAVPVLWDERAPAPPPADLGADDACLITFTSGTAGEPKPVVHAQRYLAGQALQAEHWLDARPGELVWCTAASGWSKSARNAFIAPWLRGAAALLHDARFDPHPVAGLRGLVAAGEALDPEVLRAWHEATGLWIRDGYGQTETGQLTGMPLGRPAVPGSMGRPLPGVRLWVQDGELCADPRTVPTFCRGVLGGTPIDRSAPWRTGDRVREEDGFLFFEGRTDDVIISSGYRIGPFEVESALVAHPAVAEAAVVAAPDDERGSVVRAVVVLRDGAAAGDALARELQEHVKARTAPYKYPRVVEFAAERPKTASGKVRRAALRQRQR
jgi:acyl-coenzyme A synthetase/AMP-(fatty) acid ligase